MKSYNVMYYLRVGFIVTLIVVIAFLLFKLKQRPDNQLIDNPIRIGTVDTFRDKYNKLRADIAVTEIENKQRFEQITDSFKKLLNKRSTINSVTTATTQTKIVYRDVPVYVDSISGCSVQKGDEYVNLIVSTNHESKTSSIELQLWDTLTYIDYYKKRFLASDIRTINLSNSNPYVQTTAGSSVSLKQPKSLLVVGPSVIYSPFDNKVHVGVGVVFNVFSIKTRK